ncbi:hypothetical protein QMK19_40050 [Streptomyces sp. H10-C2]|uniref:hypothetical protein n=1 Tax=unclassified Streptomyces TaxID=2593676 RepID=UPI0024BB02DE|nr:MULTISPECIES: hypothetical protein [unclassified Streptomyces]MDJ0347371.1 hypothetical protein [Streptomyces sp. PH10-H1]MDJ0375614.1 hypothetical protein [Streptomyces sp. H10-C2]
MNAVWREASVELVDGYEVIGADGRPTREVARARVAIEGGFAHLDIPGSGVVQVVSAPAVRLISYRPDTKGEPPA